MNKWREWKSNVGGNKWLNARANAANRSHRECKQLTEPEYLKSKLVKLNTHSLRQQIPFPSFLLPFLLPFLFFLTPFLPAPDQKYPQPQ
jgi:hypothetical protein